MRVRRHARDASHLAAREARHAGGVARDAVVDEDHLPVVVGERVVLVELADEEALRLVVLHEDAVELLAAETTRKALVDLLCAAYQDAGLQHKTGVFALEALDTDDARDMLDVQVQRLVRTTVLDDQVQRDTGVGVRAAIKRAVLGG